MVAKLKLKGIDGRAPPGVEPAAQFDSTRGNLPGPDIVRIDRLIATFGRSLLCLQDGKPTDRRPTARRPNSVTQTPVDQIP